MRTDKSTNMSDRIRSWYKSAYPEDKLNIINGTCTFNSVYKQLDKCDIYEKIFCRGDGDSIARERIFAEMARRLGVDYDVVYRKWLGFL